MSIVFDHITMNGVRRSLDATIIFLEEHPNLEHSLTAPIASTLRELKQGKLTAQTSGTTGKPKQIEFTLEEVTASAQLTQRAFELNTGDRALHCLPSKYIAGKMMIVRAIILGMDLHIVPPVVKLKDCIEGAYDFAAMIPLQLDKLIDHFPEKWPFEKIILGGGPVSTSLAERIQKRGINVWHTYASTETCTHVAYRSISDDEQFYKAVDGVQFFASNAGTLNIETPHLKRVCHATKDEIDLIDRQTFKWLGRVDNVVLSGGLKIYPEQLEERCEDLIDTDFYFGKEQDEALGERLVLFIESGVDELNDSEDAHRVAHIMKKLKPILAKHELPKEVYWVTKFDRTETGKIKRSN